jgi:hypothetical protein
MRLSVHPLHSEDLSGMSDMMTPSSAKAPGTLNEIDDRNTAVWPYRHSGIDLGRWHKRVLSDFHPP